MTNNETSFALLESIVAEDVDAYVHLSKYIKNCGEFPKKPVDSSGCAAAIEILDNQQFDNSSSNQMTEDMERYHLKDLFQPLLSRIC